MFWAIFLSSTLGILLLVLFLFALFESRKPGSPFLASPEPPPTSKQVMDAIVSRTVGVRLSSEGNNPIVTMILQVI